MNKTICLYISLFFIVLSTLKCVTDTEKKIETNNSPSITSKSDINKKDELYESFRKVGWIKDNRYRTIVFIITSDECKNSPIADIETKIKLAAYSLLQNELNPSSNRNAAAQIKKLIDSFGEMIQVDKDCSSENIFFYDISKEDLKFDFEKIKNIK
jgi:hypothetical protein